MPKQSDLSTYKALECIIGVWISGLGAALHASNGVDVCGKARLASPASCGQLVSKGRRALSDYASMDTRAWTQPGTEM